MLVQADAIKGRNPVRAAGTPDGQARSPAVRKKAILGIAHTRSRSPCTVLTYLGSRPVP